MILSFFTQLPPPVGIEPTAPRLTVGCSNHLSYRGKLFFKSIVGLEPTTLRLEVLRAIHCAIWTGRICYIT